MAAPAAARAAKGRKPKPDASEDSVEAQFGGDYSEASLDFIRSLGRKGPEYGVVATSEFEAAEPITQAECNAAVAALKDYERELDRFKQHVPDERERAWVDYKRALVENASPEEITWLKLKAYHHGVDALRAARGETAFGDPAPAAARNGTASAASAPLPLDSRTELKAAADAALHAALLALPSTSGGESDAGEVSDTAAAVLRPAALSSSSQAAGLSAAAAEAAGPASQVAEDETWYLPDYLEEQRLVQQLDRQRQQRTQAFVLSLGLALGVSVARWWVRRGKATRRGKGEAGGAESISRAAEGPMAQ